MNKEKALESQLFTYDGYDIDDPGDFQFYKIELKVKIGNHDVGTKFECAYFSMNGSFLNFYNDGKEISTHKLKITAE
jgi:hypothetical protein